MQVQEREGWPVPLVAWKRGEDGSGHSSFQNLSYWPFPARAAHPNFMGEYSCLTISILLLGSQLESGEQQRTSKMVADWSRLPMRKDWGR